MGPDCRLKEGRSKDQSWARGTSMPCAELQLSFFLQCYHYWYLHPDLATCKKVISLVIHLDSSHQYQCKNKLSETVSGPIASILDFQLSKLESDFSLQIPVSHFGTRNRHSPWLKEQKRKVCYLLLQNAFDSLLHMTKRGEKMACHQKQPLGRSIGSYSKVAVRCAIYHLILLLLSESRPNLF